MWCWSCRNAEIGGSFSFSHRESRTVSLLILFLQVCKEIPEFTDNVEVPLGASNLPEFPRRFSYIVCLVLFREGGLEIPIIRK